MQYEIYHSEGIVVGSIDIGEADKLLAVFTENFGRIVLLAKGIRFAKSKLRPHLRLFDLARLSFVGGKEFWRLVDAEKIHSFSKAAVDRKKLRVLGKTARILERMIKGEEPDHGIWRLIKNSFFFAEENLNVDFFEEFEAVFAARFLAELGYIDKSEESAVSFFVTGDDWNQLILNEAREAKPHLKLAVKNAFEASQL